MKKGISQIITTIMLLALALTIASSAFFFLQKSQSSIHRETSRVQESLLSSVSADISVDDELTKFYQFERWNKTVFTLDYEVNSCKETCTDWLEFYFSNKGTRSIPIASKGPAEYSGDILPTTWILYDSGGDVICSSKWGDIYVEKLGTCSLQKGYILPGEVVKVRLNLLANDTLCVLSDHSSESLFYYDIIFGGTARLEGHFKKGVPAIDTYEECDYPGCDCPKTAQWAPTYSP